MSSEASILPLQRPLQFFTASEFKANKILFPLKSISLITNGSRRQMDGLTSCIWQVFSSVKKTQLPSRFLRIARLLKSFGSSKKPANPLASIFSCSLKLMSGGLLLQQTPHCRQRKPESGSITFRLVNGGCMRKRDKSRVKRVQLRLQLKPKLTMPVFHMLSVGLKVGAFLIEFIVEIEIDMLGLEVSCGKNAWNCSGEFPKSVVNVLCL